MIMRFAVNNFYTIYDECHLIKTGIKSISENMVKTSNSNLLEPEKKKLDYILAKNKHNKNQPPTNKREIIQMSMPTGS